jgi:uncharacterized protein YukE
MPNLFEGKTRRDIARAMAVLVSKDQTEAQFSALAAQDAEAREYIVNALEKDVIELAGNFRAMIEEMGVAPAKARFTNLSAPDTAAALDEEQALTELVKQIAKLKGDTASPLLKAIAQEIAALPAEQKGKENAVYGAMFDALEKTMQADGSLAKLEDTLRLEKIQDAFGWRVTVGVKEHFNAIGKFKEFAAAPTAAEKEEQMASLKGLLFKSPADAAVASLTATDVFMRVARRVGSDAELAGLLPADRFDAKDVEVLEKNKLTSLAALVKTAIGNKPK